jgi:serine/threonine-protein kinase
VGEYSASEDFGDVAIELGFISPEQAARASAIAAISASKGRPRGLADVLVETGAVTAEQASLTRQEQERRKEGARFIGPYQILAKIGAGGFGAVYRARVPGSSRDLAIKILPPSIAKDRRYLERFVHEAQLAAKLDHDNIVRGLGPGEASGLHYFAMEFVDGENVQQVLDKRKRLSEREALDIVLPIARALQHANWHGLVHQDVKPENILIDKRGVPKLLDLGLARRANDQGARMGTPLYISPETIRGDRPVDIRSDIYSLGATLYHTVTGRPPFTGSDDKDTLKRHVMEELPWPQDFAPDLSDEFCLILSKMLAKNPDERYANPKELLYDLELLAEGQGAEIAFAEGAGSGAMTAPSSAEAAERLNRRRVGLAQSRRLRTARYQAGRRSDLVRVIIVVVVLAIFAGVLMAYLVVKGSGRRRPTPGARPAGWRMEDRRPREAAPCPFAVRGRPFPGPVAEPAADRLALRSGEKERGRSRSPTPEE